MAHRMDQADESVGATGGARLFRGAGREFQRRVTARVATCLVVLSVWPVGVAPASADQRGGGAQRGFEQRSIAGAAFELPSWQETLRVLTLRDYNTRVVMLGTMMLGLAAGLIGSFMLLRKRALLADALSHATLPGIGVAFIVMATLGGTGKWLPGLLLGALISGVIGVVWILGIVHLTRIKEDAALGTVLSVLFGLGIGVLGVVQSMGTGHAAGLESFIYGKTASMLARDVLLIVMVAGVVVVLCGLLFKEFRLLCFDADSAGAQGRPVLWLDVTMMAMVVAVTVVGLQAVGLILIIALLVIPPAAARFWTEHLLTMVITSAVFGGLSGLIGAGMSALIPKLPAGAIIVVVAGVVFVVSMVFGRARGVLLRYVRHRRLTTKVARQNVLRALFEWCEVAAQAGERADLPAAPGRPVPFEQLLTRRSWTSRQLRRSVAAARRHGLVRKTPGRKHCQLTTRGLVEARRFVRNHRLWELFLITHADTAPSQVDRDADEVEHVLDPEMVAELETLLAVEYPHLAMPASPHRLRPGATATPPGP